MADPEIAVLVPFSQIIHYDYEPYTGYAKILNKVQLFVEAGHLDATELTPDSLTLRTS